MVRILLMMFVLAAYLACANLREAMEDFRPRATRAELSSNKISNKGIKFQSMGQYDEALKCYNEALKIYPQNEYAWNNKGTLLLSLNKYEEALQLFDDMAAVIGENPVALTNKGAVYQALGSYDKAIECYDKAIVAGKRCFWNFLGPFYKKANLLKDIGRYEEAVECYDIALRTYGPHPELYYDKGLILETMNKKGEAQSCFEKANIWYDKWLKRNNSPLEKIAYLEHKGIALEKMGRIDEARKNFQKALKISDESPEALYEKGMIRFKLGDKERSISDLKQFISNAPPGMEVKKEKAKKIVEDVQKEEIKQ